jgi:hypothetical protein
MGGGAGVLVPAPAATDDDGCAFLVTASSYPGGGVEGVDLFVVVVMMKP